MTCAKDPETRDTAEPGPSRQERRRPLTRQFPSSDAPESGLAWCVYERVERSSPRHLPAARRTAKATCAAHCQKSEMSNRQPGLAGWSN